MTKRTPTHPGTVQTRTTAPSVETTREALRRADLTQEEENVLRMRLGVSEPPTHALEARGQNHPETRAKLAMLERSLFEAMRRPDPSAPEYAARRARILRKLED
ncbi:MAG: hypothetical protein AMXMBFR64_37810 [Myxococcales bacterium]